MKNLDHLRGQHSMGRIEVLKEYHGIIPVDTGVVVTVFRGGEVELEQHGIASLEEVEQACQDFADNVRINRILNRLAEAEAMLRIAGLSINT